MNAITQIAGIGHNQPPALDLKTALEPRALAAMIAAELAAHTEAAATLLAEYQRFVVTTEGGIITEAVDESAVDFAADIKAELAALDLDRKAIKEPVLAAQRAIDGAAKAIADPLASAHTEVQTRHTTFLRVKDAEIRRQAAEAAARAEEAAWHAEQEALATRNPVAFADVALAQAEQRAAEDVVFAPVIETTRMRTATGTLSGLKDNWIYEIADLSQVPVAYLQINEAVVKAAIRSGTRSIPGLKIRNEPKAR